MLSKPKPYLNLRFLITLLLFLSFFTIKASGTWKEEFNELLKYQENDEIDVQKRAFIYYVSMAKHKYDLGNYQYCSEKGPNEDLKYALFALSISDTSGNDRFIYSGSCVPAKCTQTELEDAYEPIMKEVYSDVYDVSNGLTVTFPNDNRSKIRFESIIMISLIFIFMILVIFGTVVDRTDMFNKIHRTLSQNENDEQEPFRENHQIVLKKTKVGWFFSSFSIPRNFNRIFIDDFSMQKELKIFNGLYVVSFMLVMYNNVYFQSALYGIVENTRFSDYQHKFPEFILLRLRPAYEIFYFCIGFTCCVKIWTNHYNNKADNAILDTVRYTYRRFIPQAFVIVGTMFLFEYLGHGPMYQFCYDRWIIGSKEWPLWRTKWWAPLLFLASVYNPRVDRECLNWLWIVSNEVIFFIVLVIVFYIYRYRRLYGFLAIIGLIVASMITSLVEGILLDFKYKYGLSLTTDAIIFIHPINALQGYFMGVLLALIWFSYRNQGEDQHRMWRVNIMFNRITNNKLIRLSIVLLGIFIILLALFLPFPIYNMKESSTSEKTAKIVISSIYVAIERSLISIGLWLFLLPSLVGKSGVLFVLLGNRLFVPLARLTTSALLIHGVILMWYFFGKYQTLSIDLKVLNCSWIALVLLSYVFSVVFTLIFESPYVTMENILLCPNKKKKYCCRTTSSSNESSDIIKNDSKGSDKLENSKDENSVKVVSEKEIEEIKSKTPQNKRNVESFKFQPKETQGSRNTVRKSTSLTKTGAFMNGELKTRSSKINDSNTDNDSFREPLVKK